MLGVSLSSCHRYHPAEVDRSYQSDFVLPCCLRPRSGGSAFGIMSRGHLCVHFRYGPTTRRLPLGAAVGRLHEFGLPPPCYPSYKALIITLAGLTPAGYTSLGWTHAPPICTPADASPVPSRERPHGLGRDMDWLYPLPQRTYTSCTWPVSLAHIAVGPEFPRGPRTDPDVPVKASGSSLRSRRRA